MNLWAITVCQLCSLYDHKQDKSNELKKMLCHTLTTLLFRFLKFGECVGSGFYITYALTQEDRQITYLKTSSTHECFAPQKQRKRHKNERKKKIHKRNRQTIVVFKNNRYLNCLLYTSDAADD